ncbi:MAG: serine hydrolase [Clostridia bacterium]|nr:serine hydrolase [Clostridia bacterium]
MTYRMRSMLVFLLCVLTVFMFGCAQVSAPAWEFCPVGAQFVYGIRSGAMSAMKPIVEETVGGMFHDNRQDVFVEDEFCVNNTTYEVPQVLLDKLFDTMAEYKFETSFYVIDLETHASFAYNPQKDFECASTIKAPYALFLAKQLEAGVLALDDILEYKQHHYAEGSGSTQFSEFGTLFTVKAMLYRLLYNSDNVAYYMLSEYGGVDGFNEMVADLGWTHSITKRDHWCDVTPQELAMVWQEIYNYRDASSEGRLLWKYLTENLYNEFKVAMPEYAVSAHKSGWGYNGYHEAGVVFGRRNYICVVMTATGNKNDCLHRTIRNLDNIINDYDIWLKNQGIEE